MYFSKDVVGVEFCADGSVGGGCKQANLVDGHLFVNVCGGKC